MLRGLKIVLAGGDARQLEVIRCLVKMGSSLTIIGFNQQKAFFPEVSQRSWTPEILQGIDVLLLPAVGTDDNGVIPAIYTHEKLELTAEFMQNLPAHAKVITGLANSYLLKLCRQMNRSLTQLLVSDEVAVFNSIPTAEGAILLAIQNTDFTIHGSACLVLGFGRVGMTLTRTIKALGAKVKVGLRDPAEFARAYEMGSFPFYIHTIHQEVKDIDLIFNTIPSMIITAQVLTQLPEHTCIIDLASKPGGTDFHFAAKQKRKAIFAPGLPGIVAPRTAGKIMADRLAQIILEDRDTMGE